MKVGEFVYPWGNGHHTRMMRLDGALRKRLDGIDIHITSGTPIYEKLLKAFPGQEQNIHRIEMPTPIDGKAGPSLSHSMLNVLLPAAGRSPLVSQVTRYLREERALYDAEGFDMVISDGDVGTNILARNRKVPSLFVTNQFMPKLWKSRAYLYPAAVFISKQIAKATRILVADSPPPHTLCEYNLNFPKSIMHKVEFVGHFAGSSEIPKDGTTHIERLTAGADFGYWMRTGNRPTNDWTGERYGRIFNDGMMRREKRVVSHARNDPAIDVVTAVDGARYSIEEAAEGGIDWIQIDVGFLSERDRDAVLGRCKYAVVNGSHTVMCEVLGAKSKPVIGMPVYDEHTNNIRWAEERGLGVMANGTRQVLEGIRRIRDRYDRFEGALEEFGASFECDGARNAAGVAANILEKR